MNYLQFEFVITSADQSDQLVALLSEIGFDGFEEGQKTLKACIPENNLNQSEFYRTLDAFPAVNHTKKIIENINWNEQWEESFEPVVVDDFVAIRADFHKPIKRVMHEIIITPKMSFGTGHHATTWLMINEMRKYTFDEKSVLDFGTGTGVLAILSEKLGAKAVLAIDNDEWSIINTQENILKNDCLHIEVMQTGTIPCERKFDIILANINLNVIISALSSIVLASFPGTEILLSGFLKENENTLLTALHLAGLQYISTIERGGWILVKCLKVS